MPRPPVMPADQKFEIVLGVVCRRTTVAEAARRAGVSEQSIANWRRQFMDGGRHALEGSAAQRAEPCTCHRQDEVLLVKAALADAHLQIRRYRAMLRRVGGTRTQGLAG